MKYMLLIQNGTAPTPGSDEWQKLPEDEQRAVYADYQALRETPGVTVGPQLASAETAITVRVENGTALTTDGPSVPAGSALAGYFLFEADDLGDAIELAARVPQARLGGAIEVRPIVER
jgi:hypothetical protein